jgi:hypothetical protein
MEALMHNLRWSRKATSLAGVAVFAILLAFLPCNYAFGKYVNASCACNAVSGTFTVDRLDTFVWRMPAGAPRTLTMEGASGTDLMVLSTFGGPSVVEATVPSIGFDVGPNCFSAWDAAGTNAFGHCTTGVTYTEREFEARANLQVGAVGVGASITMIQSGTVTPATGGSIAAGACLSRGSVDIGVTMPQNSSCAMGIDGWTTGIVKSCEPRGFVNNSAPDQVDIYMCNTGSGASDCDGSTTPSYRATCTSF